MNREIKFRLWNGNPDNKNAEKYFYATAEVMACLEQQMLFNEDPLNKLGWNHIGDGSAFEQYTGLKDKNGKEIYEGDIVQWKTRRYKSAYTGAKEDRDKFISVTWKSVVEWDVQSFCITESFDHNTQRNNTPLVPDDTLEVIGNIYENPDLIQKIG